MVREDWLGGCCRDPGKKWHCPELFVTVGMETDISKTLVGRVKDGVLEMWEMLDTKDTK